MNSAVEASEQVDWLRHLLALEDDAERFAAFHAKPELHQANLLSLIHAELIRCLYTDPVRARRSGALAEIAGEVLIDGRSQAIRNRCRGNLLYSDSRHAEAVDAYMTSIRQFEVIGCLDDAAKVYFGGIQPLIYLSRYEEAHAWAEQARLGFQKSNDLLRLARLELNLGNLCYRQEHYERAMQHYREASRGLRESDQPQDYAAVLSNSAVCLSSMGHFSEALARYREAQEWCSRNGLVPLAAAADYNIAYLHYLRGEYRQASHLYRLSRERSLQANDAYHSALCDLDESEMMLELNMSFQAQFLAGNAVSAFQQMNMPYEKAKALTFLGLARFRRGDSTGALKLLRAARGIFKQEENQYWAGMTDLYRAIIYEQLLQSNKARRLAEGARSRLTPYVLTGRRAVCSLVLARIALRDGRLRASQALLRESRETSVSAAVTCHALYLQGVLSERLGDSAAAERSYSEALGVVENTRLQFWNQELKIAYLQDKTSMYEALAGLMLTTSNDHSWPVFNLVQRSKSRTLLESLDEPSRSVDGDPEAQSSVLEATRNLNASYRQLEIIASAGADKSSELAAVRARIRDHEGALQHLSNQAPSSASAFTGFQMKSWDEVAQALPSGATLVEFFIINNRIHVWLVSSSGLTHHLAGAADVAFKSLQLLQFQLARLSLGRAYLEHSEASIRRNVAVHLAELYDVLISPIRQLLNYPRVIFAPISFLHHVPFAALTDASGHSLLDHFVVSVIPSAGAYLQCQRRQRPLGTGSLIVASVDKAAPHMTTEAIGAAHVLPDPTLLIGESATADAVLRDAPNKKYIHIAAHGLQRSDNPAISAIRLGKSQLRIVDVEGLRLSADLVTLSGCGTGINVVKGADELLGLTRAILSAGAKALLATLWDVSDEDTAAFVIAFYRNLLQGNGTTPAAALQTTMLASRDNKNSVYVWGAFQLIGVE